MKVTEQQNESFLSKNISFFEDKEPLILKPKANKNILTDEEFLSYGLVLTKDIEKHHIFLKYASEKIKFRAELMKNLSFSSKEQQKKYEDTLSYKLKLAQYEYDIKLLNESEFLKGKDLYQFYEKNSVEYRSFLEKNRLLNTKNQIAILSSILKFIPHLSIRRKLEKYFIEILGEDVAKKIKLFRAPKKQKVYYESMSFTKDIDDRLKKVAIDYTNKIISMRVEEQLSFAKIREILSEDARQKKLIPLTVKRYSRAKNADNLYQAPIESKTMLSVRAIKAILQEHGIK